jgi:hypothetical protein
MKLKLPLEEAITKALDYLDRDYHCGPTVLHVMWEAYGLENEDLLWASMALQGGIAGRQQASCGAIASGAVCLGLRHRQPTDDKEKIEAARKLIYKEAGELAEGFYKTFGAMTCIGCIGVDFNDEKAVKRAREAGTMGKNCPKQVVYVIERLYELEEKRA